MCVCFFCDPMDCSPPGSSVCGIFQARIPKWVAISFSRGFSWLRDQTQVSCVAGGFLTTEPPQRPICYVQTHKSDIHTHVYISVCIYTYIHTYMIYYLSYVWNIYIIYIYNIYILYLYIQYIYIFHIYIYANGFPGGWVVDNPSANAGDMGSFPGSGRSPREGNGNPLQYFHLENPMDRGAWWTPVLGVAKELDMT